MAICVLPLSKSSIVYGSTDGGKTFYNKSIHAELIIQKATSQLNLKGHKLKQDYAASVESTANISAIQSTPVRPVTITVRPTKKIIPSTDNSSNFVTAQICRTPPNSTNTIQRRSSSIFKPLSHDISIKRASTITSSESSLPSTPSASSAPVFHLPIKPHSEPRRSGPNNALCLSPRGKIVRMVYGPVDLEVHAASSRFYLIDAARLFPPVVVKQRHEAMAILVPQIPKRGIKLITSLIVYPRHTFLQEAAAWLKTNTSNLLIQNLDGITVVSFVKGKLNSRITRVLDNKTQIWGNAIVIRAPKGKRLYELMRKEHVLSELVQLNSDACTSFHPEIHPDNIDVLNASARLFNIVIPTFAEAVNSGTVLCCTSPMLVEALHNNGINLRYLEMISRSVSKRIKHNLRTSLEKNNDSTTHRNVVIDYFNLVFGVSDKSNAYWSEVIPFLLLLDFEYEVENSNNDKTAIDLRFCITKLGLFKAVVHRTGINFSASMIADIEENPILLETETPLKIEHIADITVGVNSLKCTYGIQDLLPKYSRNEVLGDKAMAYQEQIKQAVDLAISKSYKNYIDITMWMMRRAAVLYSLAKVRKRSMSAKPSKNKVQQTQQNKYQTTEVINNASTKKKSVFHEKAFLYCKEAFLFLESNAIKEVPAELIISYLFLQAEYYRYSNNIQKATASYLKCNSVLESVFGDGRCPDIGAGHPFHIALAHTMSSFFHYIGRSVVAASKATLSSHYFKMFYPHKQFFYPQLFTLYDFLIIPNNYTNLLTTSMIAITSSHKRTSLPIPTIAKPEPRIHHNNSSSKSNSPNDSSTSTTLWGRKKSRKSRKSRKVEERVECGQVMTWGEGRNDWFSMRRLPYSRCPSLFSVVLIPPKDLSSVHSLQFQFIACNDTTVVAITKQGDLCVWGNRLLSIAECGREVSASVTPAMLTGSTSSLTKSCEWVKAETAPLQVEILSVALKITHLSNKKFVKVTCGDTHVLALTSDGEVLSWGGQNQYGQLGRLSESSVPCPIDAITTPIIDIACGSFHNIILANCGAVFVFGSGLHAALGIGTTSDKFFPHKIPTLHQIAAVFATSYRSAALTSAGKLYMWGGNGDNEKSILSPRIVPIPTPLAAFSFSRTHCLALTSMYSLLTEARPVTHSNTILEIKRQVLFWGSNFFKQAGMPTLREKRVELPIVSKIPEPHVAKAVIAGTGCSYIITEGKMLLRCGNAAWGQLGSISTRIIDSWTLLEDISESNVIHLAVGFGHCCCIVAPKSLSLSGGEAKRNSKKGRKVHKTRSAPNSPSRIEHAEQQSDSTTTDSTTTAKRASRILSSDCYPYSSTESNQESNSSTSESRQTKED